MERGDLMSIKDVTGCVAGDARGTRAGFRTRGCTCGECVEVLVATLAGLLIPE